MQEHLRNDISSRTPFSIVVLLLRLPIRSKSAVFTWTFPQAQRTLRNCRRLVPNIVPNKSQWRRTRFWRKRCQSASGYSSTKASALTTGTAVSLQAAGNTPTAPSRPLTRRQRVRGHTQHSQRYSRKSKQQVLLHHEPSSTCANDG